MLSNFQITLINCLIILGVTFESRNQNGETPWEYFFQHISDKDIDKQFAEMAFLNGAGKYIKADNWEKLKRLIQWVQPHAECKIGYPNKKMTDNRYTTSGLHLAAVFGCTECLQLFIKMKIDVNLINEKSQSPLHLACQKQHINIVKTLLKNGANPNFEDNENSTTLYAAVCTKNLDIVKLLLSNGADATNGENNKLPLHIAAEKNLIEILSSLITYGADVNAKDNNDKTPIIVAVEKGNFKCADILLANNASIHARTKENKTLLHLIAGHQQNGVTLLKKIIELKLDVNAKDNLGNTPLHAAKSANFN